MNKHTIFNGITARSFSTQLLTKETEDQEQRTIPVEVFNIHIWKRTANPLKLLWSSSGDIAKSKATIWDLEEMAEVGTTAPQPITFTPTQHRNTHQKPSITKESSLPARIWKGGNSFKKICQMLKRKKNFPYYQAVYPQKWFVVAGVMKSAAALGLSCLFVVAFFSFSSKRLKRVNTRFKEMRENKGTRISQIHSLRLVKFLYFHCYFWPYSLYCFHTILTVWHRGGKTVLAQFPSFQIAPFGHTTYTREE